MRTLRSVAWIFVAFIAVALSGCSQEKEKIEYRTTVIPSNQFDRLSVSDVTWTWDKEKEDLTVQGKAKNTGTITVKNIEILIKAYASGSLVKSRETYLSPSTLTANTQIQWETTLYSCPKPDSVSLGYAYDAEVIVPALKRIF
jgi:hypothetical protein